MRIALASLNQHALNFSHNLKNVLKSIESSKMAGCVFRTGSELEISGYSCGDHFYEDDTYDHCWEVLAEIAASPAVHGIVYDIGMPVKFHGNAYICKIVLDGNRILAVVPKQTLRDHGFYAESRWFKCWSIREQKEIEIPQHVKDKFENDKAPFGDVNIRLDGVGAIIKYYSTCPMSMNDEHRLKKILVVSENDYFHVHGSNNEVVGKFEQLSRLSRERPEWFVVYVNGVGCDGDRVVFDNNSSVHYRSRLVGLDNRFGLNDQYILECSLGDIEAPIRSITPYPLNLVKTCCVFLSDFKRRSRAGGFFLALSGGIDSAVTACLIFWMNAMTAEDNGGSNADNMKQLLHTSYLYTRNNSARTRELAMKLACEIGSTHSEKCIDDVVESILSISKDRPITSQKQDTALQNVQARTRMVVSYLLAQDSFNPKGYRLVLGTGNASENIIGYCTKYDCSSADLNPVGGLNKTQVRDIARFMSSTIPVLSEILESPPSAELVPLDLQQTDEQDIGMSYEQLEQLSDLRSQKCGLVEMSRRLGNGSQRLVNRFFELYGRNRHKTSVATPCCCIGVSATDDCRLDRRPILYDFTYQTHRVNEETKSDG